MKKFGFLGISLREFFTMIFLVCFVFLFNLFIRQGRGDSFFGKVNNSLAFPYASADAPAPPPAPEGGGDSGVGEGACGVESGCEGESCESGCAVTSEIS